MQSTLLDLTFLCLLMMVFTSLYRVRREGRMRYWMLAWMLVLVDFAVELWKPEGRGAELVRLNLHYDLLLTIGICLLLSVIAAPEELRERVKLGVTLKIPGMITIFLATVYPGAAWPIRGCVVCGQAVAMWEARGLSGPKSRLRLVVQGMCAVAGLLMLGILQVDATLLPYALLMQVFVVAGALAWRMAGEPSVSEKARWCREEMALRRRERTRGGLAFVGGLVAWGLTFPTVVMVGWLRPWVTIVPAIWAFPKLLTAFGMILMVLEEDADRSREMSEEYRILFDRHPVPMWVYGQRDLKFLRVNDAAVLHYGYTREEFAGMTIEDIRPPASLPRLQALMKRRREGLHQTMNWLHAVKGGGLIDVDIFSNALCFEGHEARIVVALDVTQRKAAEEQLRHAYKVESLGQITGGVAHDFNNLLAGMMGNLEMIAARTRGMDCAEMVRHAIVSVRRGSDLTRRLLAFARQQPLNPRVVNLRDSLGNTAHFIRNSLGTRVSLEVEAEGDLWHAAVDQNELENALLNLALNARDAMPDGGQVTIRLSNARVEAPVRMVTGTLERGEYVAIAVVDTGVGMAPEVMARAAEAFFTTKPMGEGTGLGLSMVHGFLKQADGQMGMESRVGAGTTVTLYLPRCEAAMEIPVGPGTGEMEGKLRGGSERILVVEDEAVIRSMLVSLLSSLGYTVLEAEDGHRAMVHLHGTPGIDLLLTDAVLPRGLSGTLLATGARIVQPGIKVVFSSGYSREALAGEHDLDEGFPLLLKPYRLAELAECVRGVLDGIWVEPGMEMVDGGGRGLEGG